MLMFCFNFIDVVDFGLFIELKKNIGVAVSHSAFQNGSSLGFPQDHGFFDPIAGQSLLIVIFKSNIEILINLIKGLESEGQIFEGREVVHLDMREVQIIDLSVILENFSGVGAFSMLCERM